jgi:ABC-type Mn2+/Zn2+ transport system permease subunit
MNLFVHPFHFAFMQHALVAVVLIGTTCAVLGSYVVLRRMAFIGDAMAHTALPGIVIAYLNGFNLFIGALIADLLTAAGIGWLSGRDAVREDTAIGVLFTGMFALGVLIISTHRSYRDFAGMLFGDILAITPAVLILIAVVAVVVLVVLALFHKELELSSVDPSYCAVIGIRASWMRNLLLVLLALAVVTGIQAVGVIFTSALLVTPAAAASLLTRNLFRMMVLSSIFAVFSGVVGIYASWYRNVSAGAAIVLTGTALFVVVFVVHRIIQGVSSPRRELANAS